jgi:hypothetical protein
MVYFPFSLLGSLLPERRQRHGVGGLEGAIVPAPVPSGGRRSAGRRASDSP